MVPTLPRKTVTRSLETTHGSGYSKKMADDPGEVEKSSVSNCLTRQLSSLRELQGQDLGSSYYKEVYSWTLAWTVAARRRSTQSQRYERTGFQTEHNKGEFRTSEHLHETPVVCHAHIDSGSLVCYQSRPWSCMVAGF